MGICSVCSRSMLRHYSQGRLYYFCARCREEMPCSLTQKTFHFEKQAPLSDSLESIALKSEPLVIR